MLPHHYLLCIVLVFVTVIFQQLNHHLIATGLQPFSPDGIKCSTTSELDQGDKLLILQVWHNFATAEMTNGRMDRAPIGEMLVS